MRHKVRNLYPVRVSPATGAFAGLLGRTPPLVFPAVGTAPPLSILSFGQHA